jgi:hypothetical protein
MKHFLLALFLFSGTFSFSQTIFQKTYGGNSQELAYAVIQCNDGGYLSAGSSNSHGTEDVYLIKTDSAGNPQWSRTYGSTGAERATSVIQTNDGGYTITGYTNSSGTGNNDILLMHIDGSGLLLWTKYFGGADDDRAHFVDQTADGGFIIAADHEVASIYSVMLLKTDSSGNSIWSKIFGTSTSSNFVNSLYITSDHGFLLAGSHIEAGTIKALMIKTDLTGSIICSKVIGDSVTTQGYSAIETTDGSFLIGGYTVVSSPALTHLGFLVKFASVCDTAWTLRYGTDTMMDVANNIIEANGNYIVAGTSNVTFIDRDVNLTGFDIAGNILYSMNYGGSFHETTAGAEFGNCFAKTSDNGYIMNFNTSSFGGSNGEFYLIKTDSMGNSGCNQLPVTMHEFWDGFTIADINLLLVSGATSGSLAFTADSGVVTTNLCFSNYLNELLSETFTVFPSPAHDNILVQCERSLPGLIRIFNVAGQCVMTSVKENTVQIQLDISTFSNGIYFLEFTSDEVRSIKYFVKQ